MTSLHDLSEAEIKGCCANLYSHPLVRQLLGDSFHPGGTALTERVAAHLQLCAETRLMDVASGKGTSAIHLAKRFGCPVVGIDLSSVNVAEATEAAREADVDHLVRFQVGDAEELPVPDGSFDAVLCECALCTFPNKPTAVAEFRRVLRPKGAVGISDLTRNGELPESLQGLLSWIACIADAMPPEHVVSMLNNGGFQAAYTPVNGALADMVQVIQGNLLGAQLLVKLGKLTLPPSVDLEEALRVARSARECVSTGVIGYGMFIGSRD